MALFLLVLDLSSQTAAVCIFWHLVLFSLKFDLRVCLLHHLDYWLADMAIDHLVSLKPAAPWLAYSCQQCFQNRPIGHLFAFSILCPYRWCRFFTRYHFCFEALNQSSDLWLMSRLTSQNWMDLICCLRWLE